MPQLYTYLNCLRMCAALTCCRLTEQVLERCQIRRVRSRTLQVDVRHVAKHLQRWGLLGKEFTLPELAPVIIFAKQPSTDPYK